ncbi:jhy protein homolog isoform X2 [Takifugu flavidus]|uniref:Jhy protein-like protein n=1 Tax=Takifugu flavidus TaxID=433684 RepID=A0A5C6P4I7_9TELE|nr:jhy protein homolog isoform X2 [Takifugu flavidus]TWW74275.1 hypothetical protein D4764_14G0002760 [Takifugu flavidus]
MEIGVSLKKKSQELKTGLTGPVVLSSQWDSDTESLAREKTHQQRLHRSTKHAMHNLLGSVSSEGARGRNTAAEPGCGNEFEDLQIYDSLEVVESLHGSKTPPLLLAHVNKLEARGATCRALSGDRAVSYSSDATPEEASRNRAAKKGGYSYVIDSTIPAVVAGSEQPFHLHPQNGPRSSVTSTDSQLRSQLTDLSGPSSVSNDTPSQRERWERQRKTSVANKKPQQVKVDIVTNNKVTLGRSTKNQGSYLKTHALKHDLPFKVTQVDREEREQRGSSSSLSQLSEHVPEMRVDLRDSQSSLCTTSSQPTHDLHASPLLGPVPQQHGSLPRQEDSQLQQPYLRDLGGRPPPRLTSIPGSYKVLPPIEKPGSREGCEQSAGQSASTLSDSYLLQQFKTRVSYKAYTLKDYKQLKPDIELRGLGPDYRNIEKTAEKMRRQKQYANTVREQNKNINRKPFIPTKEPKDNDQKVPRRKALEYAKTIARPSAPQQPRSNQAPRPRAFIEGLNVSDLSRLEVLKKRHEEEKMAFALLTK